MSGENHVSLNKVIIPADAVRKMSRTRKRQYLMITNMLRDLNLLQKLLLFVGNNDNKDDVTKSTNTIISFFFLKTLISKNHEMWKFMQNEGLLNDNFSGQLDLLRKQIKEFFFNDETNEIFSKNAEILAFVRDKFGFHYESHPKHKKELENLISPVMDGHEMDMWLSKTDAWNEIFGSSTAVMLKVIFDRMRNNGFIGNNEALMDQLFELTLKISGIFHEFYLFYLTGNILKGITVQDKGEVKIAVSLLSKTKLPLIVKCDIRN